MVYWITAVVNATLVKVLDHKVILSVNIGSVDEVVADFTL